MHYHDDRQFSKKHEWKDGKKPKQLSDSELEDFFSKINNEHVSVMISSAAGIPASRYKKYAMLNY